MSSETELVLVESVTQYRMRYLIEVPKGKSEYALDDVTMNESKEFSQKYLGEVITSHRVISQEEALSICDEDNNYSAHWTAEEKIEAFFNLRAES